MTDLQTNLMEQALKRSQTVADRAFHQRIAGDLFVEGAKHKNADELEAYAKECFQVASYLTKLYE